MRATYFVIIIFAAVTFFPGEVRAQSVTDSVDGYQKVVRPLSSLWVETDCEYDADEKEHFCDYLRFYEDGTVISVVTSGNPNEIKRWFRRPYGTTGNYLIDGSSLRFSVTSERGKIDYSGSISREILTITVRSHITGWTGVRKYKWVKPRVPAARYPVARAARRAA
ncbi:MAG: hypothetical protein DMF63_05370 [Acidobacteria bacterium]|nr:MAG: hypothetical protein DMF63_05370 [Acidobacteriota bacterium]